MTSHEVFAHVKPNWDYWGIIDINGNYVVDPFLNYIHSWREGMVRLEKVKTKIDARGEWINHLNGQYGFMNQFGELITDFSFGYANDFSGGLAGVCKNKKWGFIDKSGKLVLQHDFDAVGYFNDGVCSIKENGKWGVINLNGDFVIKALYDGLSTFIYGMAIAEQKILSGEYQRFLIDENGNTLLKLPEKWSWYRPVSDKLLLYGISSGYPGERYYGFMDLMGNIKSEPIFYTNSDTGFYVSKFTDGKLFVQKEDGSLGFINTEGEYVKIEQLDNDELQESNHIVKRPFDEVLEFSESLAIARMGDLWGVIDENNNVVVDFIYRRRFGRSVSDKKGLYFAEGHPCYSYGMVGIADEQETVNAGYIDRNGKIAIKLKFKVAKPFINPNNS